MFAAEGIEVPVDTIAEKAGVGVGTLYRHFPTKEKLCEAILLDRLADLTADARPWPTPRTRAAAFFGFLEHVVEEGAAKRDLLVAVMGAGSEFEVTAAEVKDELRDAVGVLLLPGPGRRRRAPGRDRRRGRVARRCHLSGGRPRWRGTRACDLLAIVCDGLRPQGAA